MAMNIFVQIIAALVPTVIGFIWYNPKVFGKAWMKASGITEEKMKGVNMAVVLIVSLILSFLLGFALNSMVIHQNHIYSALMNEPGMKDLNNMNEPAAVFIRDFMAKYGSNFRTWHHGALHGAIGGFTVALPVLATNALFERKGFKYIAINAGYWIVTMAIMGAIICQFS